MPSELYVSREIKVFLSRKTAPSELFGYLSAGIDREAAEQMQSELWAAYFRLRICPCVRMDT
ncbi:hypothetical protein [Neisseria blantyrii]|uniref:hypothetical protein n=1 Tax=Neisseria blantyrii TaxID=2830647 RepID=UPI00272C14DE|nr:hypothetical protein [Neisseria blantyrii]